MATILMLLEGTLLFAAVSGEMFLRARPLLIDWLDFALVLGQAFVIASCCVVSFYYNDLYDLRIVRNFREFSVRLLQSFGVAFILLAAFYTFLPETRVTGGAFGSSLLIIVGLLLPLRALSYALMRLRSFRDRVLILGTSPLAGNLAREMETQRHFRYQVVGVADDAPAAGDALRKYPLFSPLEELENTIEVLRPDRIVVALEDRRGKLPVGRLLRACERGIVVEDGVAVYERFTGKLAIKSLVPSYLVFSADFKKSRLQLALRRLVSLLAAAAGLLLTAPVMALIALGVKLESPGPVFFIQDRAGRGGKLFRLLKFRTMRCPSSRGGDSTWGRDDRGRITRSGYWLRKFRLDELPQFWNILKGDMDLVGPRPEMAGNVKAMTEQIPYYSLRHAVRPGVTGWAQIKQGYSVGLDDVTEKIRYDLYYIRHMSLWFDLRILFDTVKVVLFGRRAEAPPAGKIAVSFPVTAGSPANGARNGQGNGTGGEAFGERPAAVNALSVDVEEYYHGVEFEAAVAAERRESLPSRVEQSVDRVLEILESHGVRATFFTVGVVAEAHPDMVRRIHRGGHEVACHSYRHELVFRQRPEEFRADLRRAKAVLEDLTGEPVIGYRAPNYSIGRDQSWALDVLLEEGFRYDSSIYPILHDRYGDPGAPRFFHEIRQNGHDGLIEFPIGTVRLLGVNLPIGGGGYFRLFPTRWIRCGIRRANLRERQPVMFFFHPWELDPDQPRPPMPWRHRFRHYVNLERYEMKIRFLLSQTRFEPARDVLGLSCANSLSLAARGDG